MLTQVPGCSPWRLRPALATLWLAGTDGSGGADIRRAWSHRHKQARNNGGRGSPDRCRQGLVHSQRLPHGVDENYLCLCPRALCSRMSTRSSARAGVRPRRCPAPCPEKETVGFICRHASPPRHLRLFYGLCAYIKSGSLPEGLFPPRPAHSPRSSYTSVSGVRNRVRISWLYKMSTGSRSIRN
jgi:hypothetical protein